MARAAAEPAALDEGACVRRRGHVGSVAVGDQAVLVDEPGGRAHAVNATGALVWQCLDGVGDLRGLVDDLADGFGADRATVRDDVLDLVRGLARLGLIEGFDAATDAWPAAFWPSEGDACAPDGGSAPTADGRYLAVPPNT